MNDGKRSIRAIVIAGVLYLASVASMAAVDAMPPRTEEGIASSVSIVIGFVGFFLAVSTVIAVGAAGIFAIRDRDH